jgi:hypothetical protein
MAAMFQPVQSRISVLSPAGRLIAAAPETDTSPIERRVHCQSSSVVVPLLQKETPPAGDPVLAVFRRPLIRGVAIGHPLEHVAYQIEYPLHRHAVGTGVYADEMPRADIGDVCATLVNGGVSPGIGRPISRQGASCCAFPFGFGAESSSNPTAVGCCLLIGFTVYRMVGAFISALVTLRRIVIDDDFAP